MEILIYGLKQGETRDYMEDLLADTRAVRVISAAKFTEENRAINHAAMRG